MKTLALAAIPAQSFSAVLGGQNCQISVYQKSTGVFVDIAINNSRIISGKICLDRVKLVRQAYLGFVGDLFFADTQGVSDPVYTGFGTRYQLVYLEASDL